MRRREPGRKKENHQELDLLTLIDVETVQSMMDDFCQLIGMGVSIIDIYGNVLVETGNQPICTNFYRVHPETRSNCCTIDYEMIEDVQAGHYKIYRCKNHMWNIVTPILLEGRYIGNIFIGQFFFEEEEVDTSFFLSFAKKYNFHEEEYIEALHQIPSLSRERIDQIMNFYITFAHLLSNLGYHNLVLDRNLKELKKLHASLIENEDKYRTLLESIPDIVMHFDESYRHLFVSPSVSQLVSLPPEDFIGKTHRELGFTHDLCHFFEESIRTVFKSGLPLEREIDFPSDEGTKRLSIRWTPEFDSIGRVKSVLTISRDNSQEKVNEENLQLAHTRLKAILDGLEAVVYVIDMETYEVLFINKYGAKTTGRSQEEIIGKICWRVFQSNMTRPCSFCTNDRLKRGGLSADPITWESFTEEKKWYECRDSIIQWMDGRLVKLEIATDITNRKEVEEKLKESEEKFRCLFEEMQQGMAIHEVIYDEKGEVVDYIFLDVNDGYERHTGLKGEDILGKRVKEVLPGTESYWIEEFGHVAKTGQPLTYENYSKELGKYYSVMAYQNQPHQFAVIVNDVTDRKLAEEKYRELAKEKEDLYNQLDEEMNKARSIHEAILPKKLPSIEGLSSAAYYRPAQRLGGDFYSMIQRGDKLIIYLSDVSGHGLDGAMLSVFIKNTINSYVSLSSPTTASSILDFLVQQFHQENYPDQYFICIYIAVLDLKTLRLSYLGAGFQDYPLISHKGLEVQEENGIMELKNSGLPLSTLFSKEKLNRREEVLQLREGTTLLFNTDGLTEHMVEETFYGQRLKDVFTRDYLLPPEVLIYSINQDFQAFNHGSLQGADDITLFALQIHDSKEKSYSYQLESTFDSLDELHQALYSLLCEHHQKDLFLFCTHELVANAIEHGNKFQEEKRVFIHLKVTESYLYVVIEDEGHGFSWKDKLESTLELEGERNRGRGILLTKKFSHYLFYNEKGNKAYLLLDNREKLWVEEE